MTSRPVRTCVGCRRRAAKTDLLRVVAEDQGHGLVLVPDPPARRPGRGAYLHPDEDCLAQALRRRAFTRALRVTPGPGGGPDGASLGLHVQQLSAKFDQAGYGVSAESATRPPGTDRDGTRRNWSNSS